MKQLLKKMKVVTTSLLVTALAFSNPINAQFDGGVEDLPVIKVIGTANGGLITLAANANVDNTFQPGYEQSKKIINIVRLSLFEETNKYLSADFTVTVPVKIQYGPNASTLYEYNQNFTVSYSKTEGVKYNAKNYFSFENAEYVKITITGNPSPSSAGGVNLADVLLVENEMRVTRYYQLQLNISPQFLSGPSSVSNPVDKIGVSWQWPANTGNNGTQLEWAWLEDELQQYYYVNGSLSYDLLFRDNTTRVDLPYNINSFNIPLFYDGQGKLYYRIRPVNFQANGSRIDGQWTIPSSGISGSGICSYEGHNNALNWQVRTSFAEEGKETTARQIGTVASAIRGVARELEGQMPKGAEFVRSAAATLESGAERLRQRSADEWLEGFKRFARDEPVALFGGAILAGFAVSRFLNSSRAHPSSRENPS